MCPYGAVHSFVPGKGNERGLVHFLVSARVSEATDTVQLVLGPLFWLKIEEKECLVL